MFECILTIIGMEQRCSVQDAASRLTAVEAFSVLQNLLCNLPPLPPASATQQADQIEVLQHIMGMIVDVHTAVRP